MELLEYECVVKAIVLLFLLMSLVYGSVGIIYIIVKLVLGL